MLLCDKQKSEIKIPIKINNLVRLVQVYPCPVQKTLAEFALLG